jgi:uncharacterized RmlC-like cupin family protein
VRVRPRETFEAKQKIPYYLGISGRTAGATSLSLNVIVVPPHAKADPHTHSEFESAIYVISGRAIHHWGPSLEHTMETSAGDFLFVAPGVPHYPENPYDEPCVAVVARNDPEEQEHVIPYESPRHA